MKLQLQQYKWQRLIFLGAVSAATGLITWGAAKSKYQREADETIRQIRYHYLRKEQEEVDPVEQQPVVVVNQTIHEVPERYAPDTVIVAEAPSPVRSNAQIYIMEEDLYHLGKDPQYPHQEKNGATYYRGDDVMADAAGDVIEDYERLMGTEFLEEFKSMHPGDYVYVRNLTLKMDWEIELDTGSYYEQMIGFDEPEDGDA